MYYEDEELLIECPYCHGTGYDPLDGGQCEKCYGSGIIEITNEDEYAIFQRSLNDNELDQYDRRYRDKTTGEVFYGIDSPEDGMTDWYRGDGTLDFSSKTPTEEEQEEIDEENGWT